MMIIFIACLLSVFEIDSELDMHCPVVQLIVCSQDQKF